MLRYQAFRQGAHLRLAVFRPPPRNPVRPRDLVQQVIDYRFVLFAFGTMMSSSSGPGVSCRYSFKILLISDTGVESKKERSKQKLGLSLLQSWLVQNSCFCCLCGCLISNLSPVARIHRMSMLSDLFLVNGKMDLRVGGTQMIRVNFNSSIFSFGKLFNMGSMGALSNAIGDLTKLQLIDFSNNKYLNGQLPPSIGNLKKLQTLILIGCKFSGTIPVELGNLSQLQTL
ncbi:receptor-like protein 31 [Zingiber officinale]|uniref:receptor-like protein 31 n=1 Tax=Zingiber officinale TaxID=94328 RepID=UPI001C4D4502|nr:receptor-like protein 31 [Zingiber officinale]